MQVTVEVSDGTRYDVSVVSQKTIAYPPVVF